MALGKTDDAQVAGNLTDAASGFVAPLNGCGIAKRIYFADVENKSDVFDLSAVLPFMSAFERHYRPSELAELWGLSPEVVRSIFSLEAGVLHVDRPETRSKRGYCSLRIPESVARDVHKRLTRIGS